MSQLLESGGQSIGVSASASVLRIQLKANEVIIHTKAHLFHSQKVFDSFYQTIFSPALTNFGVTEKEKKYVFAFYTQGTVAIIGKWLEKNCRDDIDMIIDLIMRHTMAYEHADKTESL
jgi:hypothetical protein